MAAEDVRDSELVTYKKLRKVMYFEIIIIRLRNQSKERIFIDAEFHVSNWGKS